MTTAGAAATTTEIPAGISVIIVNYNTAALALDAVESVLARSHAGRRVELHLVENAYRVVRTECATTAVKSVEEAIPRRRPLLGLGARPYE